MQTIDDVATCSNQEFDEWRSLIERILTPEPSRGAPPVIFAGNTNLLEKRKLVLNALSRDLPDIQRQRLTFFLEYLENRLGLWDDYTKRNRAASGLAHLDEGVYDSNDLVEPVGELSHVPVSSVINEILIKVGTQDVVVKHGIKGGAIPNHSGGGKRGKIKVLTRQSVQRMKLHFRNLPENSIVAMLTLTYPANFPCDGLKVKRDLKAMKEFLKRQHCGGVWFEEFQKRGAPHFHIFLGNFPSCGVSGVAKAWYRIVGSGDEKHLNWHLGKLSGRPCLEWMRKPHAASAYATKYATKMEQKIVPAEYANVGRFWGYFGGLRPVWRYIEGRGSYCAKVTAYLVVNHRCKFDESARDWLSKAFVGSTLWGCSAELDDIMRFVKWTPF